MASKPETYQQVLTRAIADLTQNGFDSAERVAFWQTELRRAAERSTGSFHQMEENLRRGMAAVYDRLVTKGGALKHHPGADRFTIARLEPKLRLELQKRILASADLIRLNRQQAITKTLQRFSGWATSIPAGGSKAVNKVKEKATVKKALGSLPFEERRVLIDQGHKLAASINSVIAQDAGAIAVIWHSHWQETGYNYRKDHKARDEQVYLLRDSWARDKGLIKAGPAGIYEDMTAVGEEPFCRCYVTYIYHLRDLPADMLTKLGQAELERVRELIRNVR